MPFETSVFINCPFDTEFRPILRGLLFSCIYLGFEPKVSQTLNSAAIRISQIKDHIRHSKYSIHDLSRNRSKKAYELARLNMPYELGLDFGCQEYGGKNFKDKTALIIANERYEYHQFISDIAGQDIEEHNNNPQIAISKVRNWLSANDNINHIPSASEIWNAYNIFREFLDTELRNAYTKQEIEDMPVADFIKFSKIWMRNA